MSKKDPALNQFLEAIWGQVDKIDKVKSLAEASENFRDGKLTSDEFEQTARTLCGGWCPSPLAEFADIADYLIKAADGSSQTSKDLLDFIMDVRDIMEYGVGWIDDLVYSSFVQGRTPPRVDPLVLDLDGDGLEVIQNTSNYDVLFDHNGDGVKTKTSWIASDDGFLVRDIDGNGAIDNGTELFGDSTLKTDGSNAVDGFDAISDLDSNSDGVIDANDAAFSELRIWQDANSDGISQAGELKSLAEHNIESISLAKTANSQFLDDGSRIADLGTFKYTDGTSGEMGVTGQIGDVDFAENTFHSTFTDTITLTQEAEVLPNMEGSGMVRDLREAASLSFNLSSQVGAYASATTRAEQRSLLDGLVKSWANTSSMSNTIMRAFDAGYLVHYRFGNIAYESSTETNLILGGENNTSNTASGVASYDLYLRDASPEYKKWIERITILERFNGSSFIDFPQRTILDNEQGITFSDSTSTGTGAVSNPYYPVEINITQQQLDFLEQSYNTLLDSVYQGLLFKTRFKTIVDGIDLLKDESNNVYFDFIRMEQEILSRLELDPENGLIDLLELNQFGEGAFEFLEWDRWAFVGDQIRSMTIDASTQAVLDEFRILYTDAAGVVPLGTDGDDVIIDDANNNVVDGGLGDDEIYGVAGDDHLIGNSGNDRLYGGQGNDQLDGGNGNDTLYGEDGNDILDGGHGRDYYRGGAGDDVLGGEKDGIDNTSYTYYWTGRYYGNDYRGGEGNDTLRGTRYGDDYHFNLGDGHDVIQELNGYSNINGLYDDILHFGADILPADLEVVRQGNDLIFQHSNGTDSVRVQNWFANVHGTNKIEQVKFADGTVLTAEELTQSLLTTTGSDLSEIVRGINAYDDIAYGLGGDDQIYSYGGNDILDGGDGNDTLDGGRGSDQLIGGAGDDVLGGAYQSDDYYGYTTVDGTHIGNSYEGGTGNDTLRGTAYGDTYRFNLGDGQDVIEEVNGSASYTDVVSLGAGIGTTDLMVTRVGNDLLIQHVNGTDSLSFTDWYAKSIYSIDGSRIERLEFADGTVWTEEELTLKGLELNGTEVDDVITGLETTETYTIHGLGGNDTITGEQGDDQLFGDAGDDTLNGEYGNDTLSGGDGNDVLDGGQGRDYYYGGAGDDILGGVKDSIDNTSTADTFAYTRYRGNWYKGGEGSDTLRGTRYGDDYIFNLGDGHDVIQEVNGYSNINGLYDDILNFGADILPADIEVVRQGNHLVFQHSNGTDSVRVQNWFANVHGTYKVEQVRFADGTTWTADALTQQLLTTTGTEASEILSGLNAYDDTMLGMGGDDELYAHGGNDILDGGDGNDIVNGGNHSDQLFGGAGDDILGSKAGEEFTGYTRDDVTGKNVGNEYTGGTGNDLLNGSRNADTYYFNLGDGQDVINEVDGVVSEAYEDVIKLGPGIGTSDLVATRVGNDLQIQHANGLDGMSVTDWFVSDQNRIERVEFADGTVWTEAELTHNALELFGTEGDDVITGINTTESYTIHGLGGNDTLTGENGNDVLYGDSGDDTLLGANGDDTLYGGDGNDILDGEYGRDKYYGGAGDDILGGAKDSIDNATSPDTYIYTTRYRGNRYEGGTGNDTLRGTRYGDDYIFNLGDGHDVIQEPNGTATQYEAYRDNLHLGAGIDPADINVERQGTDLLFVHSNGTDSVRVQGWFNNIHGISMIEQVRFADGTTWTADALTQQMLTTIGTDGADVIGGINIHDDTLMGMGGDDALYGYGGNDLLDGGDGNDTLDGGAGYDQLIGGAGDDLLGGAVDSADHSQSTNVDGVIVGNHYEGGIGNDTLRGTRYADTYQFNLGDGQDVIQEVNGATNYTDTLRFGAGIVAADLTMTRERNDLLIQHANGQDSVTIADWFAGDTHQIERVEFEDGTYLTAAELISGVPAGLYGDAGNDVLTGDDSDDRLFGDAGDDTLSGGNGQDTIMGESGNDTLNGGSGNDVLDGGTGNDTLRGDNNNDTLKGGEGNDNLNGGAHNDRLEGGAGNDTLDGGSGSDRFVFGYGDGQDVINQYDTTSYYTDTLEFGPGVTLDKLVVVKSGNDLGFRLSDTGEQITVKHWFASRYYELDNFAFADGTTLTKAELFASNSITSLGDDAANVLAGHASTDVMYGGAGNDTLTGANGNDSLYGEAGNDNLSGGNNNDRLEGGAGNDTLDGGSGSDRFVFGYGDGQDVINHYDTTSYYTDTLEFGPGVTLDKLVVVKSGNDIAFRLLDTGEQITVKHWFASRYYELDNFAFADGTTLTKAELFATNPITSLGDANANTLAGQSGTDVMYGGAGNDTLTGANGHDTLYGEAGDDSLNGGGNNDILAGGAGNDTLNGSTGSDRFVFGYGDGQDIINQYDTTSSATYTDTLEFGSGVTLDNVNLVKIGNDLSFKLVGTDDQITVKHWFASRYYELDNFAFADGTTLTKAQLLAAKTIGSQGDSTDNVMTGDVGNNVLYGGAGNDTLIGGDGNDILAGQTGDDILEGGNGNDHLDGGAGYDQLIGGAGDDILGVGVGSTDYSNSTIINGQLSGNSYEGGLGNDTLHGTQFADTYLYSRGDGQDVIHEIDGSTDYSDVMQIGAGISHDQLWFSQEGNDLKVQVIGTSDEVVVKDWYLANTNQIEVFESGDGQSLLSSQVDQLVQAMAAFAPPTSGELELSPELRTQLDPVLTANWQTA